MGRQREAVEKPKIERASVFSVHHNAYDYYYYYMLMTVKSAAILESQIFICILATTL